jgi:hypothetical protein
MTAQFSGASDRDQGRRDERRVVVTNARVLLSN